MTDDARKQEGSDMTDILLESHIRKYAQDEYAKRFEKFESPDKSKYNRPGHDKKLLAMIDQNKRNKRKIRAAIACAVVFIALTAPIMSVEAIRLQIYNFFTRTQETHIDIGLTMTNEELVSLGFVYAPPLDRDYVIDNAIQTEGSLVMYLSNGKGDVIVFNQMDAENNVSRDNEVGEIYEVKIADKYDGEAIYKDGQYALLWIQEGYLLSLMGIQYDDLIHMANNLRSI